MHPYLFEIFGFRVFSYGMAMVFAFVIGIAIALKYRPKTLLSTQNIYNFCLITMASLLFGTKLMGIIVQGSFNLHALGEVLQFWKRGSFSFFPAFILAIVLILIYCKIKKKSILGVMDYLLPIAILGVAVHRSFGCFLAGCCYGKPTNLPWGMIFPEISRAGKHYPGIPIHPTQLYYGITALMIFIFLIWYKRKTQLAGEITALGFMLLAFSYFLITFLRGDIPPEQIYINLNYSQYFSLFLFFSGFIIFIIVRSHYKKKMKYPAMLK